MSEAAKSAEEIEDVLASIRRLVSGPVPARSTETGTAERLVLTPSLRVREPDDPWARVPSAVPDGGPPPAGGDGAGEPDCAWGLEDRLADWGEIEQSAAEAVADAMSERPGVSIPDQFDRVMFSRKTQAQDAADPSDFEPEAGDVDWPDTGADGALRELILARGQPEALLDDAQNDMAEITAEDVAHELASDRAQPLSEPQAVHTDHIAQGDQPADAAAPASEIGVQSIDDDLTDPADDDLDTDLENEIEDLGEAAAPFVFPDTEVGLLDEDTLREIVAEVVRQELQGVLGQRITRNVRKMVRREIRLVLATEDLE